MNNPNMQQYPDAFDMPELGPNAAPTDGSAPPTTDPIMSAVETLAMFAAAIKKKNPQAGQALMQSLAGLVSTIQGALPSGGGEQGQQQPGQPPVPAAPTPPPTELPEGGPQPEAEMANEMEQEDDGEEMAPDAMGATPFDKRKGIGMGVKARPAGVPIGARPANNDRFRVM